MAHYSPTKRKRSNSHCCGSVSLIKGMLHIYNIVFLLSGVAVFGISIWLIIYHLHYASLLASVSYQVGTFALAMTGILAIIGGCLGCCGIFYEQRVIVLFYTYLLATIFLLELIIGSLAFYYETQINEHLERNLNETFLTSYAFDSSRTEAIDRMQQEYKCCGAIRFSDWRASEWLTSNRTDVLRPRNNQVVPESCCTTPTENCGRRDHPSNIPYTGCIYQFSKEMHQHLTILSSVGLGVCLIQIIGIILSCCLYVKLREPDE